MQDVVNWGSGKNGALKERYGFGFERVLVALSEHRLLVVREHPNGDRYAHQGQLVVEIDGYAWAVPFVEGRDGIFLKTMFPSRRATREFLGPET